ncbi:proline racemase family protein [Aureliella helgolandensis]|uniref:4-hydroxyproline epimerase n=1 Tax=Aureliella helgolandensis TaxID=2527968 RepID=A0A518G7B1_9BACT|nr:proline racemase family protein [Aureliella helgolandensis]QDV24476.1 4-hydroxyproline epimerase [Aureliella helgolandensis]
MQRIEFVDTHTGGEPTRIIVESPIRFAGTTLAERKVEFHQKFDDFRRAMVCEPRGNDVLVGALLTPPLDRSCGAGVLFFNNIGVLGMCGHGTMGVAVALHHLGRIAPGQHRLETPVGVVPFELGSHGRVTLQNVPCYRFRRNVPLVLPDGREVHGDIAWGGNWFFLCQDHGLRIGLDNQPQLDALARSIRSALQQQQITGRNGEEIDHVELIGPSSSTSVADSRNYVLCPGGAYDRSPCGTGTSAKIACLAADGTLPPDGLYRQQSIVGSVFEATYKHLHPEHSESLDTSGQLAALRPIVPSITGTAFITGAGQLLLDPQDPFCMGIQHG